MDIHINTDGVTVELNVHIYIYIEMYLYAEQIFASDGQEKFAHVSME